MIAVVLRLIWEFMKYVGEAPGEPARLAIAGAVHEDLAKLAYLKAGVHSRRA